MRLAAKISHLPRIAFASHSGGRKAGEDNLGISGGANWRYLAVKRMPWQDFFRRLLSSIVIAAVVEENGAGGTEARSIQSDVGLAI